MPKLSPILYLSFCSFFFIFFVFSSTSVFAQVDSKSTSIVIKADRVFDGQQLRTGWVVWVEDDKIKAMGPAKALATPANARITNLPGTTLLPGLIEGHSHVLLHSYNEASWNDQVLVESEAERVARATVHVRNTLMAGFTTIRDLGSEGAGYADVGIKTAIEKGIIPGPRMIVAGRAIVATGSYGPRGFAPHVEVPLGAEAADGYDELIKVVRDQIGHGADLIKVYADYRWGPMREARPTFTIEELKLIVEIANSSGRSVVAHAGTAEGMRRATLAGVATIEHGDGGTAEVFKLMAEKGVALCPTLAAGDAIMQYRGWKKGIEETPERIVQKRKSFQLALAAGVLICAGSDVGVFTHGDNIRELEMMVEYGMTPLAVLQACTAGNAAIFGLKDQIGQVKAGLFADLIAVEGDPTQDIRHLRKIKLVLKGGAIIRLDE